MKHILLISLISFLLISCSTQRNGCGGEQDVRRHDDKRFRAIKQWVNQKSDGYYVVHTVNDFRKKRSIAEFRVKPDFRQLDSLREVL